MFSAVNVNYFSPQSRGERRALAELDIEHFF